MLKYDTVTFLITLFITVTYSAKFVWCQPQ